MTLCCGPATRQWIVTYKLGYDALPAVGRLALKLPGVMTGFRRCRSAAADSARCPGGLAHLSSDLSVRASRAHPGISIFLMALSTHPDLDSAPGFDVAHFTELSFLATE